MDADVIIVGGGQAGVPLATRLAAAGKRVLLVERARLGGTCLNYGCTPTKTMVASARAAHVARTGARLGVHAQAVKVDFGAIIARKDAIVRRWRDGLERRIQAAGDRLTLVKGHARFVGSHELAVGGERYRADITVLNVGARPSVPPLPGLDGVAWLDNARIMELAELPSHLIILGGGYIGCEFAQMFRRFGSQVTIVGTSPRLLDRADVDAAREIETVFRSEGIELLLGAKAESVSGGSPLKLRLTGGREVTGSHLLVAVGRRPNTDDLGCEAGGITLDQRGFVVVDDQFRTTAPGVYAVGDVVGGPQFTHKSWDDHRLLFDILLGRAGRSASGRVVPYTVFTDPQVAGVGPTEAEARERGMEYEVAAMPMGEVARAIETDEPAGILKVLVDPKTEKVVGATIVGAEAGELIHIFVTLMGAGAPARVIVDAEMVHPTFAEGVQSVLMRLKRYSLS